MIMWNVIHDGMILNASPTLDDAMKFAKGYDRFVTISDGTTEFVGKFGYDEVQDKKLPDGTDYTWTMRRDESKSWRKKNV